MNSTTAAPPPVAGNALEKIVKRFKAGEFGPAPSRASPDADSGSST